MKQLHSRMEKEKDFTAEPEFNAENLIIRSETDATLREKLESALKTLPSRQREALFLRFYEGLTYEQIAEVMQISVNSTYKFVSKAILKLRDIMGLPAGAVLLLLSRMKLL